MKTRTAINKPKNQEKQENPQNKIQILIDDVVVQKLIPAMGFGAVIWVVRILIFQGGIWFFRAVSRKSKIARLYSARICHQRKD